MASLVAYESSDESENESANENDDCPIKSPTIKETPIDNVPAPISEIKKDKSSLFSSLPLPKTNAPAMSLYTDDKLLESHKVLQKKQPVKITIPSLAEFEEEEEQKPAKKKFKPSSKGSGLFAVLPAPKHLNVKETKRPLVPNVLTKKPQTPPVRKASKLQPAPAVLINYADSEEESDCDADFFSLKDDHSGTVFNHEEPDMPNGSHINDNTSKIETNEINDEPLTFNSKFKPSPWASGTTLASQSSWQQNNDEPSTSQPEASSDDNYISINQDDLQLNEEALQQLCGRRAKRNQQEMQLIDVSGDAIMPDPKEWLTKQLTQEQATKSHSHSHRKNDGPTTQQRRKHQITYLAFQAKENELELKNQWSQNRMSRKQTQSKYGF